MDIDRLAAIEGKVDELAEQLRNQAGNLAEVRRCLASLQSRTRELETAAGLRREPTMTAWPAPGRGD